MQVDVPTENLRVEATKREHGKIKILKNFDNLNNCFHKSVMKYFILSFT